MSESGPIVSVLNVSFSYGARTVLESVTFDIQTGDFLAVLGPNGSGKTTLLKLILGLLEPRQGRIFIKGRTPSECGDKSLIGYIPQKATHVDPYFPASVAETVAMAYQPTDRRLFVGRGETLQAVERALSLVGMQGEKTRRIGSLSVGQQQRVFIARALVNRPHLLLLDEPTTGIDFETHEHFFDMLGQFNRREGITIVLVTHDIGVVDKNVNKVACLNKRLTYHGSHGEFCRSDAFREMISGGHHLVSHRH